MPILYRSPTIRIDAHDWHITVQQHPRSQKLITQYRFRPADAGKPVQWRPLSSWQGRLPKGLRWYFRFAQLSIDMARVNARYEIVKRAA